MSENLKHECGVALLRLKKPQERYRAKYGINDWGGTKLSLLLEKQHNRGQDGVGAAILKDSPAPGERAVALFKSASQTALADIISKISSRMASPDETTFLGHLRYATFGKGDVSFCHPFEHKSTCLERSLLLAGNFNMTDNGDLFDRYVRLGHHPDSRADGYLLVQLVAHYLGASIDRSGKSDIAEALRLALEGADGAFVLCGTTGDGWAFAVRDPHGIRPGFYLDNEEIFAVASERPAIQAAFDCRPEDVMEIPPGAAIIVSPGNEVFVRNILKAGERKSCSFEKIYFSRANDADIHRSRKALGAALVEPVLRAAGTIPAQIFFSYIPNSAQVAFHGFLEELLRRTLEGTVPAGTIVPRFGQIAVKDAKFRTFIADAAARSEFYKHVYDVTYGLVKPGEDTLVVLDDSIVRGNTMKAAILPMLDRLGPKHIVIASSAPPIRYPDCYGIDISTLGELVAFKALVNLLKKDGCLELLENLEKLEPLELAEQLRELYGRYTDSTHSTEIARLLTPPGMKAKVSVVFQTIEALHSACPDDTGDWYFTGDYPTPGGYLTLRRALANYLAGRSGRSY